ncbi:hypothetical protein FUT69_09730 [Xylella taiwanensis]|nr:hypothetical protein [Xylella taiwanensis]
MLDVQPIDVVIRWIGCDAQNKTHGLSKVWMISQHFVLTMPFFPIILWSLASVDIISSGALGGIAPRLTGLGTTIPSGIGKC